MYCDLPGSPRLLSSLPLFILAFLAHFGAVWSLLSAISPRALRARADLPCLFVWRSVVGSAGSSHSTRDRGLSLSVMVGLITHEPSRHANNQP